MALTRKQFLGLGAAALTMPAIRARAAAPSVMRVTYVAAPFNVPIIVMRAKGFLEEPLAAKGIRLESPVITSGAAQFQAIAANAIDVASNIGDTSAIIARSNGIDVRAISAFSRAPKAFTIMAAANGPSSIEGLRGRKVAGPKGTTLNQLLVSALASRAMKLADVQYMNMDLTAARAALVAGQVDAATLAGADQLAAAAAGAKVLTDGTGLIASVGLIAVRGAFLGENPDLVKLYLDAHRQALDFMKAEPDEAIRIAAAEQKIDIAEARRTFALYDFNPAITAEDVKNLGATQDFLLQSGLITKTINIRNELLAPMARPA